ncbi:MAG: hypothetical protein K0R65_2271 [Crocinitomicaceae bacterium]|nr:hypothetical protein [Crocinitomicaceae bacterium]
MKRIFICFLLCLAVTPLQAQTVAMTDDFSNPANWVMTNDAGNTDNWVIESGAGAGPSGPIPIDTIESTTAANGFAIFDSDLYCSGEHFAYLQYANPIAIDPNASDVTVTFEQLYRRWTDDVYLDVSTDGGASWNFVQLNTTYLQNDQSPNPEVVNVDISSFVFGDNSVLIRFVFISGSVNGGDGCDYAWMIDDVSLSYTASVADFTVDNNTGCVGSTFTFTDASTGTNTDWSWDFGTDADLPAGTTGQGPHAVTYSSPGLKTVTLTINTAGDTETKTDFIEVFALPTVDNDPAAESQTVCPGDMTTMIDLVGTGGPGLDFTWSYTTNPPGEDIGLASPGTGDIPAFTAVNNGSTPIVATFTITPTDDNCSGTPIDITITVNPNDNPAFSYAQSSYCEGSANEVPDMIATPGGMFSSTNPGFVVDPGTGEINISSSGVGTYDVTYMTAGNCPASSTLNIDIISTPTVDNPGNFTFCDNTATSDIVFTGSASTFTWNSSNTSFGLPANGTGDILSFMPTGTGTATIEVIPSSGTCSGSAEMFDITVVAGDDASFSYDQASYCISEPAETPTITGTSGGTFSSTPAGLTIDPATGEIDFASSTIGTYDVTYTTGSATCPDANTVQVSVTDGPTVDPVADMTICEDVSTDILFTGTAGATFSWTNTNTDIGLPASGSGDIIAYMPTNTTAAQIAGTIEVTPAIGACTGTPMSFDIMVDPAEDASFTISAASICSNDPAAPTTTVTGVAGGTFSATPAGLSIDPNTGAIDVAGSDPGSYTVTYTTPGITCVGSSTQDFEIIETPVIDPMANITACSGDLVPAIEISDLSTFPIDWTNDNVNTGIVNASGSGDISSFIANNPTPGGPAIVSVISMTSENNGCVSDTVRFNFTVNSKPIVSAGADRTLCEGTPVTMSGVGSATSYTWDNGITNGVPFTPAAGSYIYTVTGTTNGCSSQDQATVTVNPAPIVNAGVDRIVCVGSEAVLTGSGAPTLTWNNGVVDNVPFIPFMSGNYVVTGTAANGCSSTDTLVLTLEDLPIPSFTSSDNQGCVPKDITFNSSATSNICIYSFSDGTVENGCFNVEHTFTVPGVYDVTLTQISVNGCMGSTTVAEMITIHPDPVASFTVDRPVVNMIDPSTFFDNRTSGAVSYEWNFGDLGTSTEFEPTHTFNGDLPAEYTVTLTATTQFGCIDVATSVVTVEESVIYYISNSFTPNGDEHNNKFSPLLYSGFDPQDYNLKIFDRIGELIFESNDASEGWDGDYGAGRGLAPAGVYTYKLQFNTPDKDEKKVLVGHVNLIR